MGNYTLGLDLGQARDYSALVIAERVQVILCPQSDGFDGATGTLVRPLDSYVYDGRHVFDEFHVRHVQQWPLGTPYDAVVDDVAELMQEPELRRRAVLAFDATGVGGAVADMLFAAHRQGRLGQILPQRFNLVAGYSGKGSAGGRAVSPRSIHKGDLVTRLVRLSEADRVIVAPGLPGAEDVVKQLRAFKLKQNKRTGNVTYEAARESDHDDLVIALALAVWQRHRRDEPRYISEGVMREKSGPLPTYP